MRQKTLKAIRACAALLILLVSGCVDNVRGLMVSPDILQHDESRALIESQLSEADRALLDRYLQRGRAESDPSFFESVTVGDALQRQRMYEQEAQMRALEDPAVREGEAALERLRAVVSIRVLSKKHEDGKSSLTLEIVNHSPTAVSGVKGVLRPRSEVGYWFPEIEILYEQPIEAGGRLVDEKVLEYDLTEHLTLENTRLDELTFHWTPQRLTLADGSTLETASGSQ